MARIGAPNEPSSFFTRNQQLPVRKTQETDEEYDEESPLLFLETSELALLDLRLLERLVSLRRLLDLDFDRV